jgi:hypothetical protein
MNKMMQLDAWKYITTLKHKFQIPTASPSGLCCRQTSFERNLSRLLSKNLKIKIHRTVILLLSYTGAKLGHIEGGTQAEDV